LSQLHELIEGTAADNAECDERHFATFATDGDIHSASYVQEDSPDVLICDSDHLKSQCNIVTGETNVSTFTPANEDATDAVQPTLNKSVTVNSAIVSENKDDDCPPSSTSAVNGYDLRSVDQFSRKIAKPRRSSKLSNRIHNLNSRIPTPASSSGNLVIFAGTISEIKQLQDFVTREDLIVLNVFALVHSFIFDTKSFCYFLLCCCSIY
jgi:hypothetical protein